MSGKHFHLSIDACLSPCLQGFNFIKCFMFLACFFFFFIGQSKAQQSTAPAPTVRPLQSQNGSDGKEMNTNIYLIYLV